MIPEREREALMRLTMCAREECSMCKYTYSCNYDFQYELATKNMNILADALRMADRKTESCSEKPNNCKHITEDGVTCAKYPACDDCLDNPLNKVKGSERLVKGSEKLNNCEDEPQIKLCRECDDYAGDGMFCASNYMVFDFSKSIDKCESKPQTERSE